MSHTDTGRLSISDSSVEVGSNDEAKISSDDGSLYDSDDEHISVKKSRRFVDLWWMFMDYHRSSLSSIVFQT